MRYVLVICFLLMMGCSKDDPQETIGAINEPLSATVAYNTVASVDSNLLSLDVYYNSDLNTLKPVVIYVHGGGWSIGDKTNQIDNKVNLFRSLNYVFVSVNYRLSPFPYQVNNPNRVKFPTHNTDVATAIKWIHNTIYKYGGNPNKIVLLGHSAGAHLVALTGTNASFLQNEALSLNHIKGVATIDTEGYNVLDKVQDNDALYINAFDIDIALNTQASPILNIASGITYPKFFVAKRGSLSRIKIADDFIQKLENNNVSVSQVNGSIYDHNGINTAIGAPNETVITPALTTFLESCFN